MKVYYRFQNDRPQVGEQVHCFTTLEAMRQFARMMKSQDPEFRRMKFWEVTGSWVRDDDGDVVVRVHSAKEIRL